MSRSTEEWIGRSDDSQIPPRVRLRVWERFEGKCHKCQRKINAGETWTCEHLKALINGGSNRETNLGITCNWCLPGKNAEDVAEKSKTYKRRSKHLGLAKKKSRWPTGKDTPWKSKIGGGVERR